MTKSEAVAYFKNQSRLAEALGITVGAVWQWPEELPRDRQSQIELITDGRLKADLPNRGKYSKPAA